MPLNFAVKTSGFTLVEVLIVMLIVSVMVGVVVLSVPSGMDSGKQKIEAERIRSVLQMASDEAVINGFEIGFTPVNKQYNFYQFNDDTLKWLPLDEKPFEEYILPIGLSLQLQVEGSEMKLGDALTAPPVLILSSGEVTPFKLSVILDGDRTSSLVISTDGFTEFRLGEEP